MRRFVVTFLAVAIAVISSSAFAVAPVINYFKSPVIADDVPATEANLFVYPDALNLNEMATDDNVTSPADIVWAFYESTGRYRVNNRQSLNLGTEDPNFPGTKQVGGAGLDDPDSVDSDVRTITFRDATLSPAGGTNTDPTPITSGTTLVNSAVMTLFASDGTTWSSRNFMVYTESNGTDRLSGADLEPVINVVPASTGASAWTTVNLAPAIASVTFSDAGNGLCIQAPAATDTYGGWVSPYNIVDLVANNVYRIRLTIDSNGQTLAAGTTPFWDLVIDNYDANNANAADNKYYGDFMNLDNEGGADSVGLGLNQFDVWYCPPPITAADWNDAASGEFTASQDSRNDMRLTYRVLDVNNGANNAANDAGTLCLRNVQVDRIPIGQLSSQATVYDVSNMTASTHNVGTIFGTTTATFAGGNLTLTPQGANSWDLEVINVDSGAPLSANYINTPSELQAAWPFQWQSNKLLKGTIQIQAPTAQGQSNPPDALQFGWDSPTTELLQTSTVAAASNLLGMPKQGSATDYVSFFYTHAKTVSSIASGDRLRLRLTLLLTQSINSGNQATNTGGIQINSYKVEEVLAP